MLGKSAGPEARRALEAASKDEKTPELREAARKSLERIAAEEQATTTVQAETPPSAEEKTGSENRRAFGLVAEFYHGTNFERKLGQGIHPRIDWAWHGAAPAPGLPADKFSIRWTGWLKAPRPGRYILTLRSDDGSRLWLDGKLVIDQWLRQSVTSKRAEVELSDKLHAIKIEYFEDTGDAFMSFLWAGTVFPEQVVPAQALFHERANLVGPKEYDLEKAFKDHGKALGPDPGLVQRSLRQAEKAIQNRQYGNATPNCDKAVQLAPKFPAGHYLRGLASFHKQDYDQAIADFTEVLRLDPKHAWAYYQRHLAYAQKGEHDKAKADRAKAIELDSAFEKMK